jgi:hypothetical protein
MKLGDEECSADIGYFLEHGEYPKYQKTCTQSNTLEDIEFDNDLYREFQEANFYEYFQNTYKFCLWQ